MRDDLGHECATIGPRSVVSLVPNLTELVTVWGLADTLAGVTEYCVSPPDAFPDASRIRGTKNPDIASIVALRPDLVLADQEENRRIDVERLRAAGLDVWVTSVRSVRDVAASIRSLGVVLDRPVEGAQLCAEILAEVDAGVAAGGGGTAAHHSVPSICMIWRDGPQRGSEERWWSVGSETYAGDLLRCAGLPPVTSGVDARYPQATLAEVRERQPRLVLLPDEPYEFSDHDAQVFVGWPVDVLRCSGRPLFWWGPRTPQAIRWLRAQAGALGIGAGHGPRGASVRGQRIFEEWST